MVNSKCQWLCLKDLVRELQRDQKIDREVLLILTLRVQGLKELGVKAQIPESEWYLELKP